MGSIRWFLGIQIIQDCKQRKLWLSQSSYIEKIAKRFRLDYATGSQPFR